MRGPSPRGERPQISRSRSGSPRRRGRSRSPRRDRRGGVTELTNKMSQFMDLMMGQQSLLMSLATARAAEEPVRPVVNQPIILPQPLSVPVAQQDAWDVDAISRDASEGEPLHGEDSVEAELTSHHSESEMEVGVDDSLWSLVERATRHLGLEWPVTEEPRRSLFESPLAQGQQSRTLPAFPDFVKEVQSTWGTPASAPATSRKAAAFTMQGASEAGLASFPPVGAAFAALVKSPTLSGLVKDPTCPNKQCRITEVHLKKGYSAATEAVRLSNLASLLSVYQAALIKDFPDYPSVSSLRTELGLIAQLLVKLAQLNARAQGRSIASLVVARRQLWLSEARVQEHDKAPLLDAPITPGHTFGPAVEEMLQRSAKDKEASQQLATIWLRRPSQVKCPQEHQWRRTPPQHFHRCVTCQAKLLASDPHEDCVVCLRAPPAEPVASHSAFQPQPLAVPVVQQPQGVWDIDAISRDDSEGEPLLEEDSPGTDLASQHSEHDSEPEALDTSDPLWSLVERATRHLGIEWQAVELPRRSLFESPSV
ncbi:UNVERIFIED_CONTAM: hypothetical protein FKN15_006668 [Acipenser sinensis]